MQAVMLNRATMRVADTTEVSGRVTAGSIKYGLYAKKQSSLWRIGGLSVFDLLLAFAVSLVTSGFALSANANERKITIITFDVPGAVNGTFPVSINPAGAIAGYYFDSGGVGHGFVRTRDGAFITFDPPGVTTAPGLNTAPFGINPAGTTAGFWYTNIGPRFFAHGFVRTREGAITKFDVPGASQTLAFNINPAGTVAGYYNAHSGVNGGDLFRGFVRTPNGAFTTFDAPGAGTAPGQGTFTAAANGLNPAGAVTGQYLDASNLNHGYVRAPNGAITTFDVPGAHQTFVNCINPAGVIAGFYGVGDSVSHGYVRAPNGAITKFDVPGAGTAPDQGTQSSCYQA
jgi:hypothetical protein